MGRTDRQTDRQTTVTIAAHAHRGLIIARPTPLVYMFRGEGGEGAEGEEDEEEEGEED